jgi:hypothetical protein
MEGKNKCQQVSQNKGGVRRDSRGIKKGDITRKYHISPSILSTFLKNSQKIKKYTVYNQLDQRGQ